MLIFRSSRCDACKIGRRRRNRPLFFAVAIARATPALPAQTRAPTHLCARQRRYCMLYIRSGSCGTYKIGRRRSKAALRKPVPPAACALLRVCLVGARSRSRSPAKRSIHVFQLPPHRHSSRITTCCKQARPRRSRFPRSRSLAAGCARRAAACKCREHKVSACQTPRGADCCRRCSAWRPFSEGKGATPRGGSRS